MDIYARSTGVNGLRGMVVDLDSTDPEGWGNDTRVECDNQTDAVIWEVHVRDFSSYYYLDPAQAGTVTVTYVDENDSEIATADTYTGMSGKTYAILPKNIKGYTCDDTGKTGTYSKQDQTITFHYTKIPDKRIYFGNTAGWSKVYAYIWKSTSAPSYITAWPGNLMKMDANGYYYVDVDVDSGYDRIIFNGGGELQTDDLIIPTSDANLYTYSLNAWSYLKVNVAVTGVKLNVQNASLDQGATLLLSAVVQPANATNQNVSWSSDNDAVAIVSSEGLVYAIGEGNANITVTTQDGK